MTKDEKQRVTLFLNPSLLKHAKAQALVEDLSLTALIEKSLADYLPKETILKTAASITNPKTKPQSNKRAL